MNNNEINPNESPCKSCHNLKLKIPKEKCLKIPGCQAVRFQNALMHVSNNSTQADSFDISRFSMSVNRKGLS